jgi:hypothetical protein
MARVSLHLKFLMNFTQLGVRDILDDLFELAAKDLLNLIIVVSCIVVLG